MHPLFKTTLCVLAAGIGLITASQVQAATKTICGVGGGCDYTSLTAAFADAPAPGDVFQVQSGVMTPSPYNPSLETWPITFPAASTTVQCMGEQK